jgi:hypothetical protein
VHEVKLGGRSDDVHGAICGYCDRAMSKMIKGSKLGSQTDGPGSYALGAVHQETSFDIAVQAGRLHALHALQRARPPARTAPEGPRDAVDSATRVKVLQIVQQMGVPLAMSQIRAEFQVKGPSNDAIEPSASPTRSVGEQGNGALTCSPRQHP